VSKAVSALKELGLVDDAALAGDLISYAADRKGLGREGIRALLRERGIPEEIIASSGVESVDEIRGAEELVRRKAGQYRGLPADKVRRRLYGMLRRRGHSSETIRKALDGVMNKGNPG